MKRKATNPKISVQGEGGDSLQNDQTQSTQKRKRRLHALSKELIALAIRHDENLAVAHEDESLLQVPFQSGVVHSQESFLKALLILHNPMPTQEGLTEIETKVLTPLILAGFLAQEPEDERFSDLVAFASSMRRAALSGVRQRRRRRFFKKSATPMLVVMLFAVSLWFVLSAKEKIVHLQFLDSCDSRACRLAEIRLWENINRWPRQSVEACSGMNEACNVEERFSLYAMHTFASSDWIPLDEIEGKDGKRKRKKQRRRRMVSKSETIVNRLVREVVTSYQSQIPTLKTLDIGCGLGGTLYSLLSFKRRLTYLGISLSVPEVNQARGLAEHIQEHDPKIQFQQQNFDESLNQTFTTMLALESLSYSPNLNSTLKNLSKKLESKGIFIIVDDVVASFAQDDLGIQELRAVSARKSLLAADEWKRSLSANGFVIQETRDLSLEFDFPEVQEPKSHLWFGEVFRHVAEQVGKLYGKGVTMNQKANSRTIQLFEDYFLQRKVEDLRGEAHRKAHLSYYLIVCSRK